MWLKTHLKTRQGAYGRYARAVILTGLAGTLIGCVGYIHNEEYFPDGTVKKWNTKVLRTWGTTDIEWANTMSKEKGSIRGDGMSDNTQKTLGDDLASELRKGLVPTSTVFDNE